MSQDIRQLIASMAIVHTVKTLPTRYVTQKENAKKKDNYTESSNKTKESNELGRFTKHA